MEKKFQKLYLTHYNILIGQQDLYQAHYQILSIIFLKELIKLNVYKDIKIKKCETCGITYEVCDCFLKYADFEDDLIEYKCLCCNKNYQQNFGEKLKEWFFNTHQFSNHDYNRCILLLQKGVYFYEYMDDWEKFNETSLPEKKLNSHLNMEDITDTDHLHAKRVYKDFEIKN